MILIDMHVHITYILSEVLNNFTHNYEYQKNKKSNLASLEEYSWRFQKSLKN